MKVLWGTSRYSDVLLDTSGTFGYLEVYGRSDVSVASLPGLSSPSYSGVQFIKLLQRADAPKVEDIAMCGGALHSSEL